MNMASSYGIAHSLSLIHISLDKECQCLGITQQLFTLRFRLAVLHTFRLTSNAILNRQAEPQREQLLRDAKTLAFFVKRLTGRCV